MRARDHQHARIIGPIYLGYIPFHLEVTCLTAVSSSIPTARLRDSFRHVSKPWGHAFANRSRIKETWPRVRFKTLSEVKTFL